MILDACLLYHVSLVPEVFIWRQWGQAEGSTRVCSSELHWTDWAFWCQAFGTILGILDILGIFSESFLEILFILKFKIFERLAGHI